MCDDRNSSATGPRHVAYVPYRHRTRGPAHAATRPDRPASLDHRGTGRPSRTTRVDPSQCRLPRHACPDHSRAALDRGRTRDSGDTCAARLGRIGPRERQGRGRGTDRAPRPRARLGPAHASDDPGSPRRRPVAYRPHPRLRRPAGTGRRHSGARDPRRQGTRTTGHPRPVVTGGSNQRRGTGNLGGQARPEAAARRIADLARRANRRTSPSGGAGSARGTDVGSNLSEGTQTADEQAPAVRCQRSRGRRDTGTGSALCGRHRLPVGCARARSQSRWTRDPRTQAHHQGDRARREAGQSARRTAGSSLVDLEWNAGSSPVERLG